MGRHGRGLSAVAPVVRRVESDHRRFSSSRAAPSCRRHLHAGAILRPGGHDLDWPRGAGPADRRAACARGPRLHSEFRGLGALHPPRTLDGPGAADPSRCRSVRRRRLINLQRQPNEKPGHRAGLSLFRRPDLADYLSPTVIQQPIPVADMTPLERLVLSLIFDAEPDGDALYFHASLGPSDAIGLSIDDLRTAFEASAGVDSTAATYVAARLAAVPADDTEIEIDFSGMSWEFIFQDIVRRSATLRYVTAVTSFTCSKMRPDGFGGAAVLITADAIRGKSTDDILEDFLAENDGNVGNGEHVLLRIRDDAVREQIGHAIETDPTLTRLTTEMISGADTRTA